MKKLFYLMLAGLLAWYAGPWLTVVCWFLPVREVAELVTPTNILSQSWEFYIGFVIWFAILWSLLTTLGVTFFTSKAQGISNTRLARRVKGLFIESTLVLLFCTPVLLFLVVTGVGKGYILDGLERRERASAASASWLTQFVERTALAAETADSSGAYRELAREAEWNDIVARPWRLALLSVRYLWFLALPVGGWFYVMLHHPFKRRMGPMVEMLFRGIRQIQMGTGGSSTLAGALEEWSLRRDKTQIGNSLFMGRSLHDPRLTIAVDERGMHAMTVAPTRSGKGSEVIIPTLLEWQHSVFVVDVKGTNAAVTARRRRELGQQVFVFDPFHVLPGESDSFDVLASLDPNSPTIREEINVIAEALVVRDPDARDQQFWDDGARTVIAGLIAHLISSPRYPHPTLPMLRDLLALPPKEQAELWDDMLHNTGAGGAARDAASRIVRGIGEAEIASILSNADKHTEWLSSEAIKRMLNKPGPSPFAMAKERPTSIYVVLPPHLLPTYNRFLRLFINLSIMQMSVGGRARIPNLMILDEFLALGPLDEVKKAFGLMAGYNLICWPFVQDYAGLRSLYGDAATSMLANCGVVQVFGVSDLESTRLVSEQLGERTLTELRGARRAGQTVPVRTPNEVALDVVVASNRQYLLRPGKPPILAERVAYFKRAGRRLFHGKFDSDPDHPVAL